MKEKGLVKNALPIRNSEIIDFISKVDKNNFFTKSLQDLTIRERFIKEYFKWVQTSKLNKLRGIKKFRNLSYVHGTSQSFDFFYAEHGKRRFRCFKGDFFYHALSWKRNYRFSYLDDGPIRKNDAVIISIPFSDNGGIHDETMNIIDKCDKLEIPVMIDLAYYNLVRDLDFDLDRPSIKSITFSLSKGFYPLDRLRIGIRCKREFTDDPVDIFNSFDMFNKAGASLGLKIIKKFSPDYNQKKFRKKQIEICEKYNLEPSKCVIFGLGNNDFKKFNRGARWNRVCISPLLVK